MLTMAVGFAVAAVWGLVAAVLMDGDNGRSFR
jgi:hypothetical protein